jgi:hypothetical protein
LHLRPTAIAFEKYYYSQPTPDGGRNNAVEDFFGTIESEWTPLVNRMSKRENLNDKLEVLFQFISMMRARVPAMRDAIELLQADQVRATGTLLQQSGRLPPPPKELGDDVWETMRISIDPHQSILAMAGLIKGLGAIMDRVGLEVLHNISEVEFITSDNPLVFFDPRTSEERMKPYVVSRSPRTPVELIFPVSPSMLLHGHSDLKADFARVGLRHHDLTRARTARRYNRLTARFGYQMLISGSPLSERFVQRHASRSPVLRSTAVEQDRGTIQFFEFEFASRRRKEKWIPKPAEHEDDERQLS